MAKSKVSTVTQLLLTAVSMLVIPVSLFFVGRWYLFAGWENTDVYSAIIAILAVSLYAFSSSRYLQGLVPTNLHNFYLRFIPDLEVTSLSCTAC